MTTPDGVRLAVHHWAPPGNPLAQAVLIHGLGEHCGRYEHVAAAFTKAGFALQGMDLRGHGHSGGPRGHAPNYDILMQDIDALIQALRLQSPLPLFLYGHSLGGNLVINYLLRRQPGVTGAIAASPLLQTTQPSPPWKLAIGKMLRPIWPRISMSNGLDSRDLSHDPLVIEKYRRDPLVHRRVSASLGVAMLEAGQWALEHAAELTTPLLLLHGQEDRITSAEASRLFAQRSGPICSLKLWPDCFHELHNDQHSKRVIDYMTHWMIAKAT
jgi:acylglycerol lipase